MLMGMRSPSITDMKHLSSMGTDVRRVVECEQPSSEMTVIENPPATVEKELPYPPIADALWKVEPLEFPYVLGPSAVSKGFTVEGPAVYCDLRVYEDYSAPPSVCQSVRQSVSYAKAEDLKALLLLLGPRFADWKKYLYLEACRQRRVPLVHLLLGTDKGVNFTGPKHITEMGYAEFIKAFTIWDIKSNTNIIDQHYLLHSAAMFKQQEVVQFLIGEGARVNFPDEEGSYPIHLACASGNLSCVKYLAEADAPINCINLHGNLPIHKLGVREAIDTQDVAAILDILILAGPAVEVKTEGGQTLLQLACKNSKINALKAALLFGASKAASGSDTTPLCVACQEGNNEVVQVLQKYHTAAEVCHVGPSGDSPLSLAIKRQQGTIVQKLIHKAFDLEVRGKTALAPIYQACMAANLILPKTPRETDILVIGDLIADGPLFPLRKSSNFPPEQMQLSIRY